MVYIDLGEWVVLLGMDCCFVFDENVIWYIDLGNDLGDGLFVGIGSFWFVLVGVVIEVFEI